MRSCTTPSVECGVGEGPSLQTHLSVMLEKHQLFYQHLGRTAVPVLWGGRRQAGSILSPAMTAWEQLRHLPAPCAWDGKAKVRFSEQSHAEG